MTKKKKREKSLLTIRTPYTACLPSCRFPTAPQCADVSACDILLPRVSGLERVKNKRDVSEGEHSINSNEFFSVERHKKALGFALQFDVPS
jgi:hypothetical protein